MKFLKPGVLALLTALCYVAPNKATAQATGWTLTQDKLHYHPMSDSSGNSIRATSTWEKCEVFAYECTPPGSGSASASNSWALVWNGPGTPAMAAVVNATLYISGSVNPSTASGASDMDGDMGAAHVSYLPANPGKSFLFTLNYNTNATIAETVSASASGVMFCDVISSASCQLN